MGNGAALKQSAACSVLLVSLECGREAHAHARPLECGSARLSLFAVRFFWRAGDTIAYEDREKLLLMRHYIRKAHSAKQTKIALWEVRARPPP